MARAAARGLALAMALLQGSRAQDCFHPGWRFAAVLTNVTNPLRDVGSAVACQTLCAMTGGCNAFGYTADWSTCWLGSGCSKLTIDSSFTMGPAKCPTPGKPATVRNTCIVPSGPASTIQTASGSGSSGATQAPPAVAAQKVTQDRFIYAVGTSSVYFQDAETQTKHLVRRGCDTCPRRCPAATSVDYSVVSALPTGEDFECSMMEGGLVVIEDKIVGLPRVASDAPAPPAVTAGLPPNKNAASVLADELPSRNPMLIWGWVLVFLLPCVLGIGIALAIAAHRKTGKGAKTRGMSLDCSGGGSSLDLGCLRVPVPDLGCGEADCLAGGAGKGRRADFAEMAQQQPQQQHPGFQSGPSMAYQPTLYGPGVPPPPAYGGYGGGYSGGYGGGYGGYPGSGGYPGDGGYPGAAGYGGSNSFYAGQGYSQLPVTSASFQPQMHAGPSFQQPATAAAFPDAQEYDLVTVTPGGGLEVKQLPPGTVPAGLPIVDPSRSYAGMR